MYRGIVILVCLHCPDRQAEGEAGEQGKREVGSRHRVVPRWCHLCTKLGYRMLRGNAYLGSAHCIDNKHRFSNKSLPGLQILFRMQLAHWMKVLIVLTSHDKPGDTGEKTGFWLEEFASPYYRPKDAGGQLTLASPESG